MAWLATLAVQRVEAPPLPEQSVEVELRSSEEYEALLRPKPAEAIAPPPTPAPIPVPETPLPETPAQDAPVVPPPGGMVQAQRMLARGVLSHERSREARALLDRLAADERAEQLCGVEAMAQIHAWQVSYEPDRVTAYALADTIFAGLVLRAQGAAFRSRRRWYALRFDCTVSADLKQVTAFSFSVGEAIPAARWKALGLPPVY